LDKIYIKSFKRYYLILLIIFGNTLNAFAITCNTKVPFTSSNFSNLTVTRNSTGICGTPNTGVPLFNDIHDEVNLIDGDIANYAEFSPALCDIYYSVKDTSNTYAAGSYAGYKINAASLIGISLAYSITIETYHNGSLEESQEVASNLLSINPSLLNGSQNAILGFITTSPFDEIRLNYSSLISIGNTIKVYHPVIEEFCAGSSINCNEKTAINNPSFPVVINMDNTGYSGVACVSCVLNNAENILSNSTSDYATVDLTAGLLSVSTISVQDILTTYPSGYFAGFEIENSNILGVDLLDGITITTYLNGTQKESNTGGGNLLSISSSLLSGSGRTSIGFLTTEAFNEVEIKFSNILSVNLGETRIYNLIIQNFCNNTIGTDTTYWLNTPDFPVIVNEKKSGLSDTACGLCSISEMENIITQNNTDYSTINIPIGAANTTSISVKDVLNTYPPEANVGFNIQDLESIIQADLFNAIEICTYNNDTLQECKSGANLINVNVLNVLRIGGGNQYNIGFTTTKEFDEVQLKISSLVSLHNKINVYGAFLEVRDNILSIELLSFDITKIENNQANLKWSTAIEINNDYFDIQRSSDGINFENIGKVLGSGNSNMIKHYKFIDKEPHNGMNYYRLKQVDYNGQFSYSPIKYLEINTSTIANTIIYPNPSIDGSIYIENRIDDTSKYVLYNSMGQKIMEKTPSTHKSTLNVANLKSGIYFLKINKETFKIDIKN